MWFVQIQGGEKSSNLAGICPLLGQELHQLVCRRSSCLYVATVVLLPPKLALPPLVALQNCHLAKSWMPQLVKLVEEVEAAASGTPMSAATGASAQPKPHATSIAAASPNTAQGFFLEGGGTASDQQQQLALHPNFRLWLTSSPVDFFPPAVLHKGVRMFLEPPRGLKPTLLSIYSSLPRGHLSACDSCGRGQHWRQLVFAGALLHGLLCERRRFGPLGWNVPYEFSDGDLSCALANIQVGLLPKCTRASSAQSNSTHMHKP
jgi:hypothetical protein